MDRKSDDEKVVPRDTAASGDGARGSVASSVDLEPYLKRAPVCSLETDEEDSETEEASDEPRSPVKRPYLMSLSSQDVELEMNKNLVDDERQSNEASTAPIGSKSDLDNSFASADEPHIERADGATAYNLMEIPKAWQPSYTPEPPSYAEALRMEPLDIEEQSQEEKEPDCSRFGPLSGLCSSAAKRFNSPKRMAILILVLIGIIGLALMVVLIPTSFVSLEYNLIALETNVVTGTVDRSRVYYPGCYLLTPSTEFIEYPGTVHNVAKTVGIMTTDQLTISVSFYLHYFIKPEELGKLHEKFDLNYEEPLDYIIISTIKNVGTHYSLDDYRGRRIELQEVFRNSLIARLGGNCCPSCCPNHCKNKAVCTTCKSSETCDSAYHIEIRLFNLANVEPPSEVLERYMRGLLLQIQEEKEQYIQDKVMEVKQSELEKKRFLNTAQEILASARAKSEMISTVAAAEKDKIIQISYINTLKTFYEKLNIQKEEHKLSLMMIRSLEDAKNLIHPGFNFEKETLANL